MAKLAAGTIARDTYRCQVACCRNDSACQYETADYLQPGEICGWRYQN